MEGDSLFLGFSCPSDCSVVPDRRLRRSRPGKDQASWQGLFDSFALSRDQTLGAPGSAKAEMGSGSASYLEDLAAG